MPEQFEAKLDKEEARKREEITEQRKVREFFEYLKPLGEVFSGYSVYGLRIDPAAPSFAFNHEKKEVIISTQLIEGLNLEKGEQRYVLLHELGHLIQLFQDPESYLESFEIPKKKAQEANEPAYEKAYNNFFNTFFDIHANSIIKRQMPVFQKGERDEKLPENFYSQKAFPIRNYTDSPRSVQFLDYLLRRTMVPAEEIEVSLEVKEKIESPVSFFGKRYSNLEDFVRGEIFNPRKTTREIMFRLKEILMPVYEELLERDKNEGRLREIPTFLGEIPMDGDLSVETIKKIAEGIKEAKKPSQAKYRDALKRNFKEWAKDKGFSEEEIKRIEEIQERTIKTVNDLEDLWNNFFQKSVEIERERVPGFVRGSTIVPEKLVSELPILLTKPSEAEIFGRYLPEQTKESIKPKKINLVLITDLSGSMDEEKRRAVQEVAYSLNKSLINFYRNSRQQASMRGWEFPLSIDFQIIGFGDSLEELTARTPEEERERSKKDTPQKNLDEDLLRAILKIEEIYLGGTQDALALNVVQSRITPAIEKNLKEGEEVMVVIEITDGETATKTESKSLVKGLNSKEGVYCRAIQIPGPIYSEVPPKPEEAEKAPYLRRSEILPATGIFQEVWGDEWGKRLENLSILKETVVAILYDALRKHAPR